MSALNRRSFLSYIGAALGSLPLVRRFGFAQSLPKGASESDRPLVLWYDAPAKLWVDALPIGNGSLGAMVYGGGEDGDA